MRNLVPAILLVLALCVPASADHCTTWSSDDDVELDTNPFGLPGPRYYYDNDPANLPCCVLGVWFVYEESNGIDGLQRGDEAVDNTCHGMIAPDTIRI